MTIDRRFALITDDNVVLYPYKKKQTTTGRFGFAVSSSSYGRDRHGGGHYTESLEEVIRGVLFDAWSVRARTDETDRVRRDGSYGLGKRSVQRYWLAEELIPLARGARLQPDRHLPAEHASTLDALRALATLGVDDYVRALLALQDVMPPSQRKMLVGHALAPNESLSIGELAKLGGFDNDEAGKLQYGSLGKLFHDYFSLPYTRYALQAIAVEGPPNALNQFQWSLRPAVTQALEQLGWLDHEPCALPSGAQAEEELINELGGAYLSETERRSLVNARIGQGAYRKNLLRLWGNACAVTGCGIESVLVASHAKPWRNSTNAERLNPYNGLLLSASLDRLFDGMLVSFNDEGRMIVSPQVTSAELEKLGLRTDMTLRFVRDEHKPFLRAHRQASGLQD